MTEDSPIATAWHWVKGAPLPVVLALVLILGGYTVSVATDAADAKATAKRAEEKAEDSKKAVDQLHDDLKDANSKLDRLLAAVAALKQQAQDNADKQRKPH